MKRVVVHCSDGSEPVDTHLSIEDTEGILSAYRNAGPDNLLSITAASEIVHIQRRHIAWISETSA